jgi:hypothetical protein
VSRGIYSDPRPDHIARASESGQMSSSYGQNNQLDLGLILGT